VQGNNTAVQTATFKLQQHAHQKLSSFDVAGFEVET
jgi:hypothetical protein